MKNWETACQWQTTLTLQQAWRAQPEPDFLPATVRVGWTDEALVVLADLSDADIHNPVTQFNEPAFQHGDAFEIFLRPDGQDAYFEFHVTPDNCVLQLRFPSVQLVREQRAKPAGLVIDHFKIAPQRIATQTRVSPERQLWQVLATVPYALVVEGEPMQPGHSWLMAFARYDYTRGRKVPVLSSTAAHRVVDFHRPEDWTRITWTK